MQSKIDKRLNPEQEALLKSLIGKKVDKIRHDRFDYSNVSYERVTIFCEDEVYELNNGVEALDFMWDDFGEETVAVFKFFKTEDKGIDYDYGCEGYPAQVETPVEKTLIDVILVEDHVEAFSRASGDRFSQYDYVKGVILVFEGIKYSFVRDIWFSDDITIYKGNNPEAKIGDPDEDWEPGEEVYYTNVRKMRSLK